MAHVYTTDSYLGVDIVTYLSYTIGVILFATMYILFLTWINKAYKNLVGFQTEGLKFSPGWAVGWFFVPVANYFKPYQVLKELWKASAPDFSPKLQWTKSGNYGLIGWYWVSVIISNVVSVSISFVSALNGSDIVYSLGRLAFYQILIAIPILLIVFSITKRQNIKHQKILANQEFTNQNALIIKERKSDSLFL